MKMMQQNMLIFKNAVLRDGSYTIYIGGALPSQRSLDLGASASISKQIILTNTLYCIRLP
jgi:hypothetical protein